MANIVGMDGKPPTVQPTPPVPKTFSISLIPIYGDDGKIDLDKSQPVTAEGFLIATSAFVGIGFGEGEIRALVPLDNVYKVTELVAAA